MSLYKTVFLGYSFFIIIACFICKTSTSEDVYYFVEKYAPYIRFDSVEGSPNFCFPHDAEEYYIERTSNSTITTRICNTDYGTILNNSVPTYWHAMECGYHLHIAYWVFYGYNHDCDCCSGERDAWWEFMVIKVRDWQLAEHLHEVMYGQKSGWYTRIPGEYSTYEDHPVAYVGKASHGFYHDDGGTGTCCYYEDFRNPTNDHYMKSWENLVELKNGTEAEDWMVDPDTSIWNGLIPPSLRADWDLCNLRGCTGSSLQVCGTCGCHKSDIGDGPF